MSTDEHYQYKISDSNWEDLTIANKCKKSYLPSIINKMQYKATRLEKKRKD